MRSGAAALGRDEPTGGAGPADTAFRALSAPVRRTLLDALLREDGQTLGALVQRVDLTRFGVMKHVKVLVDAGLVKTQRHGRETHHFLDVRPIRSVHDQWLCKFLDATAAEPEREREQHDRG